MGQTRSRSLSRKRLAGEIGVPLALRVSWPLSRDEVDVMVADGPLWQGLGICWLPYEAVVVAQGVGVVHRWI